MKPKKSDWRYLGILEDPVFHITRSLALHADHERIVVAKRVANVKSGVFHFGFQVKYQKGCPTNSRVISNGISSVLNSLVKRFEHQIQRR
jgi:hypothetical protein